MYNMNMPSPSPTYGQENGHGIIHYGDKVYKMDMNDLFEINNFKHSFKFQNPEDEYPSYNSSYKSFSYLDFLFKVPPAESHYVFKNGDKFDLRRENVEIFDKYYKIVDEKYDILDYFKGHRNTMGKDANIYKNPMWRVKDGDEELLIMYCEKNTLVKLCSESYQKILDYEKEIGGIKLTWYICQNGYVITHDHESKKGYYMHQIITGCYGNGQGTGNVSVDHIDRNPLNNTLENLRVATREEQQQNRNGTIPGTKRERQANARPLPEGITQDMLRKYVVYYFSVYDVANNKSREYFRVEGHPKLKPKCWESTKSNKVSILEKLAQANQVVDDLENDVFPQAEERYLPRYVSLITFRGKPHLVFEKRVDGKRLNLKMVLPTNYDLKAELEKLNQKISEKYPEEET
jgi:HNH endonuclease